VHSKYQKSNLDIYLTLFSPRRTLKKIAHPHNPSQLKIMFSIFRQNK